MDNPILCPWCGAEMLFIFEPGAWDQYYYFGAEMIDIYEPRTCEKSYYCCSACGARSPSKGDLVTAQVAARKRYTPPLKPLTLEEAKVLIGVWIEDSCSDYGVEVFPAIYHCRGYPQHSVFIADIDDDEEKAWFENECYGFVWRCWPRRPTNEERKAAKWE